MIEAVADASTGEFERLKEFGIKAKQQGDQVAFTFQGTTTKVGKSAEDIEAYLMKIGEVNFAGGMARQADTLDGALSNLGDTWDQTLIAFSQSGFGDVVRGGVMALSGALAAVGVEALREACAQLRDVEAGERIACDLLVMWGERGVVHRLFDPAALWRSQCAGAVTEMLMPAGHYIPEELPETTAWALRDFFTP